MPKTTPTLSRRTFAAGLLSAPLWSLPAWTQTPALPKEVRIGYQKGSAILLLDRKTQAVEKRLKALGVEKLTWVEFQFGPPLLEALGAGAIDLGSVGDTPPIFAQAGQAHLVYVAPTLRPSMRCWCPRIRHCRPWPISRAGRSPLARDRARTT